jgi:uncharacterized protein
MTDQPVMGELTSDDKLWSLLSWILAPIVPIIVLLMEDKKSRPFIKYNAVVALAWSLIFYIVGTVLSFIFVGCIISIAGLIGEIYFGIKAYNGETVVVPVLTDFVKNQGWA